MSLYLVLGLFPGERFRWKASNPDDPGCDPGNKSTEDPGLSSEGLTSSQLYVWAEDHPELREKDPACAPSQGSSNQGKELGKRQEARGQGWRVAIENWRVGLSGRRL